jgi:hypothetical protein
MAAMPFRASAFAEVVRRETVRFVPEIGMTVRVGSRGYTFLTRVAASAPEKNYTSISAERLAGT